MTGSVFSDWRTQQNIIKKTFPRFLTCSRGVGAKTHALPLAYFAFGESGSLNVPRATAPSFQSSNASVTFAVPASAAPSTLTVSWRRQLQHRCFSNALTRTGAPPAALFGNSRSAVG